MFRKEVPLEDLLELDDNDLEVEDIETSDEGELNSTSKASPSKRQPAKVNLDEFDEFRQFKSNAQKREAQAQRERDFERQQRQALEDRLRRIEMEGLDDAGRLKYERDEALRTLDAFQREQQRQFQEFQWNSLVEEVARETGIPVEQLEDAKDSNDLWRIGRKYERTHRRNRDDDDDDDDEVVRRPVDDRVHIGGGKSSSTLQRIQDRYNNALKQFDMDGMFAAEEEAIKRGLRLKHQQ